MDPPEGTAGPLNQSGGVCVETYLRKGKNTAHQREEKQGVSARKNPGDPKVREGGGRGASGDEVKILPQYVARTTIEQRPIILASGRHTQELVYPEESQLMERNKTGPGQRTSMEEQQQGAIMDGPQTSFPMPVQQG